MRDGYTYVWEFRVATDALADFERHYGPDGTWATLFKRSQGYVETLLLADRSVQGRYLTVDRWRDEAAYSSFLHEFATDYAALDSACEALTIEESFIGAFRDG